MAPAGNHGAPANPLSAPVSRQAGFADLMGSLIGDGPQPAAVAFSPAPQSSFAKLAFLPAQIPDALDAGQPDSGSSNNTPIDQDRSKSRAGSSGLTGTLTETAPSDTEKLSRDAQAVLLAKAVESSPETLPFLITIPKPAAPPAAPPPDDALSSTSADPRIPVMFDPPSVLASAGSLQTRKPLDPEAARLTVPTGASTQPKAPVELAFAARLLPLPPNINSSSEPGTPSTRRPAAPAISTATDKTPVISANSPEPIPPASQASDSSHKDRQPASEHKTESTESIGALHTETPAVFKTLEFAAAAPAAPHASNASAGLRPVAAPPQSASKILDLPEAALPRSEPARDISLRFSSGTPDSVEVQLVEKAGEIHVAVRSSNPELTSSLQAGVAELSGKLERSGFQTESWIPDRTTAAPNTQPHDSGDPSQHRRAPLYDQQQSRGKKSAQPGWLDQMDDTFEALQIV